MHDVSIHDGHRERLRANFIENSLDSFNELNSLELLLFYAIPRRDTNELAHRLLDRFGSLSGVFDASFYELMEVDGIGENAASLITLIPEIMRKSRISGVSDTKVITSSSAAGKYLVPRFLYQKIEILLLLCLDSQKRVISCVEVNRGVVNSVDANVRRIVELALKYRATSVIISHNHPDGVALPSREDDFITGKIGKALSSVGITLSDHIIVAGETFASYADSGMMSLYR